MNLYINNLSDELAFGVSGSDWIIVDPDADYFIFSTGSVTVKDGETIPEETELNRAAVQLDDTNPVNVSKCFLADATDNKLKEVINAGNQNKQYAFCCVFDGATASEPQLEAWNNSDMNAYNNIELGTGTPANSWYKAVCTNTGTPGVDWATFAVVSLAGSGSSNILLLNNGSGALSVAGNLYFNFKVVIPGGHLTPALHSPIFVVTYTTN